MFFLAEFLAINVGNAIGAGPYDIGIVVAAISLLNATLVICTLIIVDAIKNIKKGE